MSNISYRAPWWTNKINFRDLTGTTEKTLDKSTLSGVDKVNKEIPRPSPGRTFSAISHIKKSVSHHQEVCVARC